MVHIVLRRSVGQHTRKNLAVEETSKLGVLTRNRGLRQEKLAEASIVCNGKSLEAGAEGDGDIGTKVVPTIDIGCRIVLAPIMDDETLARFKFDSEYQLHDAAAPTFTFQVGLTGRSVDPVTTERNSLTRKSGSASLFSSPMSA